MTEADEWQLIEIVPGSMAYKHELELRDQLLRRPLGLSTTPEDIQNEIDHWHFGMVAESNPLELLACVIVVDLGEQRAKIRQMAVAEDRQRGGIGSCLIRRVEMKLRHLGFRKIELNAREPVIGFYQRLGYEPVGPRFEEVTIEHQKMVQEL